MDGLKDEQRQASRHFSVTLPAPERAVVDGIAAERGTSVSAIVREAVLFWLSKREVAA